VAAKYWLLATGAALIAAGIAIRWRMARYDLKDAAIESAWTLVRGRRTAENPTAIEAKLNDIRLQPTWQGRATRAAGTVAGHFAAQWLSVVALILAIAGLALGLLGWFWG
jgi:hypothetical protein